MLPYRSFQVARHLVTCMLFESKYKNRGFRDCPLTITAQRSVMRRKAISSKAIRTPLPRYIPYRKIFALHLMSYHLVSPRSIYLHNTNTSSNPRSPTFICCQTLTLTSTSTCLQHIPTAHSTCKLHKALHATLHTLYTRTINLTSVHLFKSTYTKLYHL